MSANSEVSSIITIDRTKRFNALRFTGTSGIDEQDERSLSLTEIDLNAVRFESMLEKGEDRIHGEVWLSRLKATGHIRLDAKILQALWYDIRLIPDHWKQDGVVIMFDGTILLDREDRRSVLYLSWYDGAWNQFSDNLDFKFGVSNVSAVL